MSPISAKFINGPAEISLPPVCLRLRFHLHHFKPKGPVVRHTAFTGNKNVTPISRGFLGHFFVNPPMP